MLFRSFDRNPAERVLRFLDGATSPAEDLAVMRSSPLLPMTGAVLGDAVGRLHARLRRDPAPVSGTGSRTGGQAGR